MFNHRSTGGWALSKGGKAVVRTRWLRLPNPLEEDQIRMPKSSSEAITGIPFSKLFIYQNNFQLFENLERFIRSKQVNRITLDQVNSVHFWI